MILLTEQREELARKETGERKVSWGTFSNSVMRKVCIRILQVEMVRVSQRRERLF